MNETMQGVVNRFVMCCSMLYPILISTAQPFSKVPIPPFHCQVAWLPKLNHTISAQWENWDGQEIRHARAAAAGFQLSKKTLQENFARIGCSKCMGEMDKTRHHVATSVNFDGIIP